MSSDNKTTGRTQRTPTKRSRSDSPPSHQHWASHPPLKDTILQPIRQNTPSPSSIGCCVPRSKSPILPWGGFGTEEALNEFLDEHFDESGNYYELKKCDDCERIASAPFLENGTTSTDPIKDTKHYLHKIINSNDLDTMESKYDHNTALMNNTQLQIIHEGIKQEMYKKN